MRINDAAEAVRILKGKLSELNINPEYITVSNIEQKDGKWIIEFEYLFRTYVAELDSEGRLLSLKSKLPILIKG
jgi:hypothetical protein